MIARSGRARQREAGGRGKARSPRAEGTDGPISIDALTLMMGQRQLRGSSQDERSDLYEALQLVASGKVKPALETYPLAEANAVRERLAAGKMR